MGNLSQEDIDYILKPNAIRESTKRIFDRAVKGETHFKINLKKMDEVCDFVKSVIQENYPDLNIPFHSKWRHLKVGARDREKEFNSHFINCDKMEIARAKIDFVIISVLLDAQADGEWCFTEDGTQFNRSEGLAVASYHMFLSKVFSSDDSLQVDIKGLRDIDCETLEKHFQVDSSNPLKAIKSRHLLLNNLANMLEKNNHIFPGGRPGNILDYLISKHGKTFEVCDILNAVLKGLGQIWPGEIKTNGINLGDTWHYKPFGDLSRESLISFHRPAQWLTYSLIAPLLELGINISGAHKLTGLAEYRNGGLFLDMNMIELKDQSQFHKIHAPNSELIIEWRALTIQLLDRVSKRLQVSLGKTEDELPIGKLIEGGTWWAGRKVASEKRADGSSPFRINSDGVVF